MKELLCYSIIFYCTFAVYAMGLRMVELEPNTKNVWVINTFICMAGYLIILRF